MTTKPIRFELAAAILTLSWLLAGAASAQDIEGKLLLGLDLDVVGYQKATVETGGGGESSTSGLNVGVGTPAATSPLLGTPAGLDIGYGMTDALILGLRLGVGFNDLDAGPADGDADFSTTVFSALPHVDYVFGSDEVYRPYVSAMLGGGVTTNELGDADLSVSFVNFGAALGAHVFMAEGLSLDPRLQLTYGIGSAEVGSSETDLTALRVGLSVGLTGWL